MTFLELQRKIVQTRKARRGVKHSEDYFIDRDDLLEYCEKVYREALREANRVVKRYTED